jgi:hypothetical protein
MVFELSTIKFDRIGKLHFGEKQNAVDLIGCDGSAPPFDTAYQYLQDRLNDILSRLEGHRTEAALQQKQSVAKAINQRAR